MLDVQMFTIFLTYCLQINSSTAIREEKMRAIKVSGVERLLTPPATAPPARGQHAGRQDVYIDIAAVADYGVYSK